MKIRLVAFGFVLGAAASLAVSQALSQDSKGQGAAGENAPGMPSPQEMEAAMEAWEEAMTPGEPHKQLMRSAGTWDTVTKIWMAGPGAPPTESKGTAENKAVLGGRFLMESSKFGFPMPDMKTGEMTTLPVEGVGLFGYDNYQKVYIGCWADTMGTQLLTMRGNLSQDGSTLTMYGEMDEPMLGVKGRMVRYVTRILDDNHHVFTIYDLHAGEDYKVVEVDYKRRRK